MESADIASINDGASDGSALIPRSKPKTPHQKEALEKAFLNDPCPSEEDRKALGDTIGLTEQQVQAWYINRRRKDKRPEQLIPAAPMMMLNMGAAMSHAFVPPAAVYFPPVIPAATIAPAPRKTPVKKAPAAARVHTKPPALHTHTSASSNMDAGVSEGNEDFGDLIEAAKATIEGFREDGPPLGFVFDRPPLAAGAKRKSSSLDYASVGELDHLQQPFGKMSKVEERFAKFERERAREDAKRAKDLERIHLAEQKELKRLELLKDKERKAEEKKKLLEDKKREREVAKALAHQDKQMTRIRHWYGYGSGPPDDLDLEWERLTTAAGFSETDLVMEAPEPGAAASTPASCPVLARPPFPPPSLDLKPAFPKEIGNELGGEVLTVWNFLYSFSDVLGLMPPSFDDLLHALVEGRTSGVLPRIHIALLRLLQADMEEAFAAGAAMVSGPGNFIDRALAFYGSMLEEAWGWGFDVDAWRAHLGPVTWCEILRQVAIISGAGPKRVKPQKGNARPKIGTEGEDVVVSETGEVTLKMPARFGGGTMKAAAWLILSEAPPAGLSLAEIAHRMAKQGLRDLSTIRNPESSIAQSMSRDVVFHRVATSTFALQSVITHQKKLLAGRDNKTPQMTHQMKESTPSAAGEAGPSLTPAAIEPPGSQPPPDASGTAAAATPATKSEPQAEDEADYNSEEDDEDEDGVGGSGRQSQAEPWLQALMTQDYDSLSLVDRLAALSFLVNLVTNGPTVRAKLDERSEQGAKLKKALLEEVKNDKKKKPSKPSGGIDGEGPMDGLDQFLAEPGAEPGSEAGGGEEDEEDEQKRHSQKMDALRKVDDENLMRMEPLGLDRRHNRYWRFTPFKPSTPPDPSAGRIFIEDVHDGTLLLLDRADQLDALLQSLDPRGVRERDLTAELARLRDTLIQAMPAAPIKMPPIGAGVGSGSKGLVLSRIQAESYLPPDWCDPGSAYRTGDFRLIDLKAKMVQLQEALPSTAIIGDAFDRDDWLDNLQRAMTPLQLRTCLGELEAVIIPGFLTKEYVRHPRVVLGAYTIDQPVGADPAGGVPGLPESSGASLLPARSTSGDYLSWLPPTFSAIALRLATLDASLLYDPTSGCTGRDLLAGYRYVHRPPALPSDLSDQLRSTKQWLASATFTAPVQAFGRIRPLQMLPILPGNFMSLPAQEFVPPLEELRRSLEEDLVSEIQVTWRLRPAPLRPAGGAAGGKSKATAAKGKGSSKKAQASKSKSKKKSALARSLETADSDQDYSADYDDGFQDDF